MLLGDIQNQLPEEKFKAYLVKVGASSTDELFTNTITQVFLLMVHDFKTGIISLDELCVMTYELFSTRVIALHDELSETGRAMDKIYDLAHDLRFIQDKTMANHFVSDLKEVLDFYDKYENAIKTLLS